jgi:acyl-CoA reductase-like NAD-dependent aldehyde dehydrogenase
MNPDVRQILELRMRIGGDWVEARSGKSFETVSPATGEILAVLPQATREDGRAAIEAAGRARARVAAMSVFERAEVCDAVAGVVDARRDELARELSLEQGKPYREAVDEVTFAAELFRDAGENVTRLETGILPSIDPVKRILTIRQPHGVVAIITPWNYPVGIPSEYLSAALASGNAIVWKPAPTTSLIAVRLTECLLDAGVPEGAVNLVFGGGDVGDEIVSHPGTHAVGFTGSSAVGKLVARSA